MSASAIWSYFWRKTFGGSHCACAHCCIKIVSHFKSGSRNSVDVIKDNPLFGDSKETPASAAAAAAGILNVVVAIFRTWCHIIMFSEGAHSKCQLVVRTNALWHRNEFQLCFDFGHPADSNVRVGSQTGGSLKNVSNFLMLLFVNIDVFRLSLTRCNPQDWLFCVIWRISSVVCFVYKH